MHLRKTLGAMTVCIGLFATSGCGLLSTSPMSPTTVSKEAIPVSSHGLNNWRIVFTPDLNFNIRYIGPQVANPEFTLLTKSAHGEHWHRFYTTGRGLVKCHAWGSALTGGQQFVGLAKLVVTWMTGSHAHKGYAIYRIRELKSQ